MEPLIYYPNFEPPSDIWLKFSLLYFENFKPIVPYNRRHLISNNFRLIEQETDLITLYAPDPEIGFRASLSAIEEVEKILASPHDRSPLFNQVNIVRKWRNSDNWSFLVYREKFADNWSRFCRENKLGRLTEDGMVLPEELAFLFMTYLAKEIAFKETSAIITDNTKFDNFTNYSRVTSPSINKRTKFAKGLFNFIVPQNLSEISFAQLIEFRNKNRNLIAAFNQELDNVQDRIGEGYSKNDFIESYNHIYSEYCGKILTQGLGVAPVPFAIYMLIQNTAATAPEYVKEILGALGVILAGGYALNKGLKDTKTQRYCKKYITNLERLK